MNRRDFLTTTAALSVTSPQLQGTRTYPGGAPVQRPVFHMRQYLADLAREISEASCRGLNRPGALKQETAARRAAFAEAMRLDLLQPHRGKVPVHPSGTLQRQGYRIEKLAYESLPGLYVTANLYVPDNAAIGGTPAVLYVCGHAPKQKWAYQAHARRFAQLGFLCLIAETVQLGEAQGFHHGCYREGWWNWYSRGYSPAMIECMNGIRGVDLLLQRPETHPQRLGVTGISGGGASTWWIAAADERIKAAAPVCSTAHAATHVADRIIDGHCDCMWWINWMGWDLPDIGAMIAPRPLMIASANRDPIFPIESIRAVHTRLMGVYRAVGAEDNLRLVETPGGHAYHAISRTRIQAWFLKHLAGREDAHDRIEDYDDTPAELESEQTLRVFSGWRPQVNRAETIHDELIKPHTPPPVPNAEALRRHADRVVQRLKRTTFQRPVPRSSLHRDYAFSAGANGEGYRFSWQFERRWSLFGRYVPGSPSSKSDAALVALRSVGEARGATEAWAGPIRFDGPRLVLDLPGTGDTAWGHDLQWYLRRASAWCGLSIAAVRVRALLQAMEALLAMPELKGRRLFLAAQQEMAPVACVSALLSGIPAGLVLEQVPASLDTKGDPGGTGGCTEMLGILQTADMEELLGCLYPRPIWLVGAGIPEFAWLAGACRSAGEPEKIVRAESMSRVIIR